MLKYHYSNPKFKGLPWGIDQGRKKKKGRKKQKKERGRLRRERNQKLKQERNSAASRCTAYLASFWPKFNAAQSDQQRLSLLKAASNPGWGMVSEELRRNLRNRFSREAFRLLDIPVEKCATCDKPPEEKHHIVPLCYGGINDELNLILICLACHKAIHPWME